MSKIKVFPTPEYTCKQPKDSVVPRLPMTGVLLGPSKSGKSTALVSMILEQYRGCFERIYIASASINVDDSWKPVKKYIEEVMKVPVDREQVYFEDWDEAALRRIINQQAAEDAIPLPILIVVDDEADSGYLNKKTSNSVIDTLFVRGRHFQISTLVSTQKLRLVSNAVRVNSQFFCIWRLRNQLEKDSLLEELTALAPKPQLEAMYEAAVAEPYSFLYIYLLNPLEKMFHIRFKRVFQLGNVLFQSECKNISCCSTAAANVRVYDPSKPPWMQQQWQQPQPWAQQISADSGTAGAAEGSVDTKTKLSNLVTQGKAAANKLAKVVAGEQTANPEELEALKSKAAFYQEYASLPKGATDKRTVAPDGPGPPKRGSWRRSRQAPPARLEELSAAFALASLVFFLGEGVGGVD